MTKEEQEMIARALEAHADRIKDVAATTHEAIKVARKTEVGMARVEERLIPLERGISEIKDSVKEITKALKSDEIVREVGILKSEFHSCRSNAKKVRWWLLGILATIIGGAGATILVQLFT